METNEHPQRMDIWFANLPLRQGSSVQGGARPVVIISNDICNTLSTVLTVVPMTRQMKKLHLPTHVVIDTPDGGQSLFLAEQLMTIDRRLLSHKMGKVKENDVEKIEQAVREQLGIRSEGNEQHYYL